MALPCGFTFASQSFADRPIEREFVAWEHERERALRAGRWKLVARHDQPWELYDIDADRVEMNDIAAKMPDRVSELSAKWDDWATRTQVLPYPTPAKKK